MTLLADAPLAVEPTHLTLPDGLAGAGAEAAELAASAGLVLDPWQARALERALVERPDGRWAATEVGMVVPRQNGKGSILEARELAGLYLFGDDLIVHTAHEFKTAMEAFRRLWSLIESTPDLSRKVKRKLENNNGWTIELTTRQRVLFIARSKGSGRGFSGDTVVFDEAYELPGKVISALLPTMSARPNPQIWYTSSAPLDHEGSDTLRRICKRGREGAARVAYMEWCAAEDAALDDLDAWSAANPGLEAGRLSAEFIETELGTLEPDDFARERLGRWSEEDHNQWIIPKKAWFARSVPDSKPGPDLKYAVDVSPDRMWSSIGVAAKIAGGRVHVELVDRRPGTGWLPARAVELQARWGGECGIAKGSPAWALKQDLENAGVRLRVVSPEEHAQACGDLFDAVGDETLVHIDQEELNAAVAGADKRLYAGDSWLWSRRTSMADISPLVAVTLAHWMAAKRHRKPKIL